MSIFRLGLIGYPLSHSFSPAIHTAALNACGLEGDYSLFPILPDDEKGLKDLLIRLRTGELRGLNVTIPHKQNVIGFLDELTPTAETIDAVNTIYYREHKLIGDNTDAPGFLSDLKNFLAESLSPNGRGAGVRDKSAIILGAGGSARAIVHALLSDSWNITVVARRIEQAKTLASQFEKINVADFNLRTFQLSNLQLLVNATPIGMTPDLDQSPLPENLSLPSNVFVYDLVYNPHVTRLVREARGQGCHATTGLGMLIEQAALSFEIWTGQNPSRQLLRDAAENLSLVTNH